MDEKTYVPSLTLNPTQAAAQEAPAAPQLVVEEEKPAVEPEKLDIDRLSPEEQAAVREFAKQIDVTDTNLVLSYGAAAQKNIADFSGAALGKVRTKDMGEVGDMLTSLVVELKDLDYDEAEQKKGLRGLFKKASRSMEETKAKFDKAEINVDKITQQLQNHQVVLAKDIASLDRMFELNHDVHHRGQAPRAGAARKGSRRAAREGGEVRSARGRAGRERFHEPHRPL